MKDMHLAQNIHGWHRLFRKGASITRFPHEALVTAYYRWMKNGLATVRRKRVLDIGCGGAADLSFFLYEKIRYIGVDVTDALFDLIRRLHPGCGHSYMLRTFSPPHLPFKESSFDIVIGFQSIHLNSAAVAMRKMIAEVHRVLKPGGYFFFTVLDDDHYIMIHDYARFVGKNTIEIRRNFPEKERHGMRYFFFRTEGEVKEYFSDFSTVRIGKSLLELDDGKVSSWRIIFGQK